MAVVSELTKFYVIICCLFEIREVVYTVCVHVQLSGRTFDFAIINPYSSCHHSLPICLPSNPANLLYCLNTRNISGMLLCREEEANQD